MHGVLEGGLEAGGWRLEARGWRVDAREEGSRRLVSLMQLACACAFFFHDGFFALLYALYTIPSSIGRPYSTACQQVPHCI